jgi:repressor LexA
MQRLGPLNNRQQQVLSFFNETVRETGAPPTIRAVMQSCGLKSPRGAELQLKALAKCGFLVHKPGVKPAYRPRVDARASNVPILGSAPAGYPVEQSEEYQGSVSLPWRFGDQSFAIRVTGDSMRDAHILHGDIVVVDPRREPKNGDVVLAMIDGKQTIKRLRMRGSTWWLEAANSAYPMVRPRMDDDRIVGCIGALARNIGSR